MDEPILEQIAEKIVSELNTITLANGYWQDLHAGRTKQTDIDGIDTWITEGGFPYTSGYTIVSQTGDDEADKEDSAGNMSTWDQPFSIMAFVTESDRATESADTKINRIIADVRKILCHTNQLGGLALWLAQGPAAIFRGKGFSGVEIVIAAHYRTKMNDPYSL